MERIYNIIKFKLNNKFFEEHPNEELSWKDLVFTKTESGDYFSNDELTKVTLTNNIVRVLFDAGKLDLLEGNVDK